MDYGSIKEQLVKHEGLRLKPYKCSAGRLTIGIGRNIEDVGISESEAMMMLDNDIEGCVNDLQKIFFSFGKYPEKIKHVLIDMRFQLGPNRFRGFRKMIRAVAVQDWAEMVEQMRDSAWYGQTKTRADCLISMVKNYV